MTIKRVLVPTDFSDNSSAALDYAADLARTLGAEVHVLFVIEPLYYAMSEFAAPAVGELLEEQRRGCREQLAQLERRYAKRTPKLRVSQAVGTAHQAIVEGARRLKADLIVMATHGRTGVTHLLLGSVAERVVRTARCPVLTVRPPAVGRRRRTQPSRARRT